MVDEVVPAIGSINNSNALGPDDLALIMLKFLLRKRCRISSKWHDEHLFSPSWSWNQENQKMKVTYWPKSLLFPVVKLLGTTAAITTQLLNSSTELTWLRRGAIHNDSASSDQPSHNDGLNKSKPAQRTISFAYSKYSTQWSTVSYALRHPKPQHFNDS